MEQIGSVYEAVMGFELQVASGRSIAIKPTKSHGAPATINLEALVETKPAGRAKQLQEWTDQKITGAALTEMKAAESIDGLLAALAKKIAKHVTPNVVPKGAMVFQPSDERRRSGSHYTPRSLTEPIVRTTLEPILKQLVGNTSTQRKQVNPDGEPESAETHSLARRACIDPEADLPEVYQPSREDKRRYTKGELAARIRLSEKAVEVARQARRVGTPHPAQILDLKICDPAMGSGAFLVETCRQLGDELVRAWYAHDAVPANIPSDEDELLYARRLVAQRCLYGVDKNDMAVDLAKLSLWLVTLAKDHAFTFLDHSLRHGDSLVGLTNKQIAAFHWDVKKRKTGDWGMTFRSNIAARIDRATEARAKILNAREDVPYRDQEQRLALADEALNVVRMTGDACVSAFFAGSKKKEREARCEELFAGVSDWYASGHDINRRGPIAEAAASLRTGEHPLPPFHWEIEFPEVFSRENGGFDAFVGNPPFAGKNTLINGNREGFFDWLKTEHEESHGASDLVAHFFRRAYSSIRADGTFGLIATNSISQGDTRSTGLRWICMRGGVIFRARRRVRWPGAAAVVISVVHTIKKPSVTPRCVLNQRDVPLITAYLFHAGGHDDPAALAANSKMSFQGAIVLGMGFTFDDRDSSGSASPISIMRQLITKDVRNQERILPYLGGEEVSTSPTQSAHRFVIDFGDLTESEARRWPDLMEIVENRVKPQRLKDKRAVYRKYWWQFAEKRLDLRGAMSRKDRVLVVPRVGNAFAFVFVHAQQVLSDKLIVIPTATIERFAILQSRSHEVWTRFQSTTLKDDLQYTPSLCFETFPFPHGVEGSRSLGDPATEYYNHRAAIMRQNNEGLTKTYNRFHDPHEKSSEIAHLRELHAAMDRAVLEAYGWDDLAQSARCEFLLDYEEEDDDNESGRKSKKKKPWRLRWPDEFRDEVLVRLLELNEQRHQEELLAGKAAAEQNTKPPRKTARRKKSADSNHPRLPGMS